ncbi:hypothetical protein ACOMHN_061979 [Nucella lapillus]
MKPSLHSDVNTNTETVLQIHDNDDDDHSESTPDNVTIQTTPPPPLSSHSEGSSSLPEAASQSPDPSSERSTSTDAEFSGEVEFRVGQDRQLMIGSRHELATISPVFRALFSQSKKEKQTIVEIPEVPTQSFGVILRCAARDSDLPLTEDTVWTVLNAAHYFQIAALVTRCFRFLLERHRDRQHPRHLCSVLDKTHQLGYPNHHATCLHRIKPQASNILHSASALAQLCHRCMTDIITADDLPVPEILIHDAVVSWARSAFTKDNAREKPHFSLQKEGHNVPSEAAESSQGAGKTVHPPSEPSWEEVRALAGPMVYHVRYLAMPRHKLQGLRAGESSCLLSQREKASLLGLLEGNVSGFPQHVATPRRKTKGFVEREGLFELVNLKWKGLDRERFCKMVVRSKERKAVIAVLVLLLVFWVVFFCSYETFAAPSSEPDPGADSPVYILMVQEEQQ